MKKLIISIILSLTLVAIMAVPAIADTSVTASVGVNEFASVTINAGAGINWGALNPGVVKQATAAPPAVTITAAAENNVDVTISVAGTNFSTTGGEIAIANAFFNTVDNSAAATAMSTSPAVVGSPLTHGDTMYIYHWLTIPANQKAGGYTSTFVYSSSH